MNVTGFSDSEYNDSFAGNRSVEHYDVQQYVPSWRKTIESITVIMFYVACSLGIPGNILSAIVWIRRHIASENPSAVYLSALAINDLVYLISECVLEYFPYFRHRYVRLCARFTGTFTMWFDSLLVLSFSVVRLIAIRRPLQVCCIVSRFRLTENSAVVERPRDAQWHFEFFWVENTVNHDVLWNCRNCRPYTSATVKVKCCKRSPVIQTTCDGSSEYEMTSRKTGNSSEF